MRGSSVMLGLLQDAGGDSRDPWWTDGFGPATWLCGRGRLRLSDRRKKNLIITKNGENVSPEELENKIGENRLVQEILVREKEGVIEAEIYPDYEYAKKKHIKDIRAPCSSLSTSTTKRVRPTKRCTAEGAGDGVREEYLPED